MDIVVCVKQVYDTSQLKFDEATGEMRPGAELILNPFCEYALETALRLKEAKGEGNVVAFSLGGSQAKEALKKAIAMGTDEAFLLDDPAFDGSDSSTTALALAKAIQAKVPDASLIFFGQSAVEGATGATGPQVAECLDLASMTYCKQVDWEGDTVIVQRETETGIEKHKVTLPAVICTMKCDYEPRMANIKGVMKANRTEIPSIALSELGLSESQVGKAGANNVIQKTFPRPARPVGKKLEGLSGEDAANAIVTYLKEQKFV